MRSAKSKRNGSFERMIELEEELYAAIKIRNQHAAVLKENISLQANLLDTSNELEEAASLYKKLKEEKLLVSQTQSNLDIALIEIDSLKEELIELKELNSALLKKKFSDL
jgi:oligoendopeptidase F